MSEANLDIKSVFDLRGMNFFIPNFQRGYRWERQQVRDLLDDLNDFLTELLKKRSGIYSLQPLVVKSIEKSEGSDDERWMVIDGQQRLTTISILLQYLGLKDWYKINYEVLQNSNKVNDISDLSDKESEDDINLYHMKECYNEISLWFKEQLWYDKVNPENWKKSKIINILTNKTKFIWYQSDEDSIKVFTRLNIDQIKLTNSELIKALFLNRSNFDDENLRIRIDERAEEWDKIENTLQNDEFFLFLNSLDYYNSYDKPTRIDFLFDFICNNKKIQFDDNYVGTDKYRTFRCFYYIYKNNKENFKKIWNDIIKKIFDIFYEWYNDIYLYHYIGYILCTGKARLNSIYEQWISKDKSEFIYDFIFDIIKRKCLASCQDINKEYDINNKKAEAEPLLLLHNIQTVINQNHIMEQNTKYKLGVFYKFPFHIYKKENWNIEHIDSNTENELDDYRSQKSWVLT